MYKFVAHYNVYRNIIIYCMMIVYIYIHNGSIYCNVYEPLCNISQSFFWKRFESKQATFFWRFLPRKFSGLEPILPCWWTRMGTTLTNSGRKTRQPLDGRRPVGPLHLSVLGGPFSFSTKTRTAKMEVEKSRCFGNIFRGFIHWKDPRKKWHGFWDTKYILELNISAFHFAKILFRIVISPFLIGNTSSIRVHFPFQ